MGNSSEQNWRRMCLLSVLAALISVVAGGAAWVLLRLINVLTHLALYHHISAENISITHVSAFNLFSAAAVGAIVIALLARRYPIIRGHGLPEAMDAVLNNDSRIKPSTAVVKPLSAAIAIGTGGPFGAEGPIIVTGGALGSLVGQVISVSPAERKVLLAAGAAAGMAATFGTPLAAVILAVELLLFEFSTRSFIPLVVASTIAAGLHVALFGSGPLFQVPLHNFDGLEKLPLFAVLGVLCGLLATIIAKGLFVTERLFERMPINQFWHPLIGALGFASIGIVVPRALGVGYGTIGDVLQGHLALSAMLVICLAKLFMWWWAIASGTSGGTLAPMLLVGGSFGALMGGLAQHVIPSAHVTPQGFALVAMAAVFGSSTRTTFASIVFLFELTRDYQIILPLMLACVLARLVADRFLEESVMTEKLARRGIHVHADYSVDPLHAARVADILSPEDCKESIQAISVSSKTTVFMALRLMNEFSVDQLSVDDDGRHLGYCRREDVLSVRNRQFSAETRQPGWFVSQRS